ncbi:hypothetical protein [Ralstonia solanacearum]|uniref:hypothetical protein n=1 Tax=Ralstonia solanacearum TaxID=305 RepID=UPI001E631153|nr:hypothetical protein [Ralstonia solanacearum]
MHRIDGAGNVNGTWVAEDAATNRPPTEFTADWNNAVQEEVASFIEWCGLALVKADNTQLRQAIAGLFQSGRTVVGTDTGAANAYVVAFTPALTAPVPWAPFWIKVKTTNTGPSTLDATGAPHDLVGGAHAAFQGNEMVAGGWALIYWNPTLNGGTGQYVLAFCTGASEQVGAALASQHAVPLGQMQAITGSAGSTSFRNKLINSGAQVVIQSTSPSLSTSPQYGPVEMVAGWASGGAITAGTLLQDTAAPVGRSGKAVRFQGCTLTGAGQLSWRYRMESGDAVNLKNQTATFQIKVQHNTGAAINYTTIIRKPTAADNYATTTVIGTSAATSVPSGTAQTLKFSQALGDCSYGLEIEVQAACGAVATKDFWWTEWGLEEGSAAATIEFRPTPIELVECMRYYQADTFHCGGTPVASGAGSTAIIANTSSLQGTKTLPVQMRAAPTLTYKDMVGNSNAYTVYNGTTNQGQTMTSGGIGCSASTMDMDATWGAFGATWCRLTYVLNARL